MQFAGSHILSIQQFEREDVERVFEVADRMEPYAHRRRVTRVLDGALLGSMFFEPRTRTRKVARFVRIPGMASFLQTMHATVDVKTVDNHRYNLPRGARETGRQQESGPARPLTIRQPDRHLIQYVDRFQFQESDPHETQTSHNP